MRSFRFTLLLSSLLCLSISVVNTQMQGCSLQGIDLQHCSDLGQSSVSFDTCCETLNQALLAGYHCLCLVLGSSNPPLTTPILLSFTNCFISVPPLTKCREPLPGPDAPTFPMPAINHPPPTATPFVNQSPASPSPLLSAPAIQEEQPQPSAPNNSFAPLPPEADDIPLGSNPNKNSSADAKEPNLSSIPVTKTNNSRGKMIDAWFHSRFFVAVVHFMLLCTDLIRVLEYYLVTSTS